MKKSNAIRQALAGGKKLSTSDLRAAVGDFNSSTLNGMVMRGEIIAEGAGRKHTYPLNPDYQPARRGAPSPRRKKRGNGKHPAASRQARTTSRPDALRKDSRALALDNLLITGEQLRTAIRELVEDYESDALLAAAMQAHQRAQALYEALHE